MKIQSRNLFSEIHIQVNPIYRDLIVVTISGLLVATAILTMVVMFVSKL